MKPTKTFDDIVQFFRTRSRMAIRQVNKDYWDRYLDAALDAKYQLDRSTRPCPGWDNFAAAYNGVMCYENSIGKKCSNPFPEPKFENAGNPLALEVLMHYDTQIGDIPDMGEYPARRGAVDFLTRCGLLEAGNFSCSGWVITPKGRQHIKQLVDIPFPRPDTVSPAFGWRQDVTFPKDYAPRRGPNMSDAEIKAAAKYEDPCYNEHIIFNGIKYKRVRP